MKKLIGLLLFLNILTCSSIGQTFMSFKNDKYSVLTQITKFEGRDIDTLIDHTPNFAIFTNVYFNRNKHLGIEFNPTVLDSIEIIVGGYAIDPLLGEKFTEPTIIDITQSLKEYFMLKYEYKYPKPSIEDAKKINKSVKEELTSYIGTDGELLIILYSSKDKTTKYRIKAEEYGFIYFNKSLPINAQFSGVPANDDLNKLVNLYYPFQIIPANSKNRWVTNFLKRVSFGPYLLSSFDGNISIKGGGMMAGFGLSENGTPIIGCGIGFANEKSPFFMFTINPIEIMRIMFNPQEVKTIFRNY